MEEKREITVIDSLKCFFYSIAMPILFSAFYYLIIVILSYIFKVDYEVFENHWLVKGISYILNSLVFLLVVYVFFKRYKISFTENINFKKNNHLLLFVIVTILGFVLVLGFNNFINLLDTLYAFLGYSPDGNLPIALNSIPNVLISLALWAVLPAVVEELLFRGIIFKGLLTKFKPVVAIVLGALFFMLMHGSLQQTLYQFVLGIVLCTIYYQTRNILYPMLLHFLNNAIVIVFGYLQTVHHISISIAFTTIWSVIWTILIFILAVVLVVLLLWWLQKANKKKEVDFVNIKMIETTKKDRNFWWIMSLSFAIVIWLLNTITTWIGL